MTNIINSFKAHLYERTTNPFLGTFIFYWSICNYKLIMVILDGDMSLNAKFNLIKKLYPQDVWTLWNGFDIYYSTLLGNGLLIPLLITLIYIFAFPYPAKFIYAFWKEKQKEIQEIKQDIDNDTSLPPIKLREINESILELTQQNDKLKEIILEMSNDNKQEQVKSLEIQELQKKFRKASNDTDKMDFEAKIRDKERELDEIRTRRRDELRKEVFNK